MLFSRWLQRWQLVETAFSLGSKEKGWGEKRLILISYIPIYSILIYRISYILYIDILYPSY